MYCSLVKEHPLVKERPPPTFGLISCIRVKVYSNEYSPWSELRVESLCNSAIQSVVCHQNLTSKPPVVLLYATICPVIGFEGIEFL